MHGHADVSVYMWIHVQSLVDVGGVLVWRVTCNVTLHKEILYYM